MELIKDLNESIKVKSLNVKELQFLSNTLIAHTRDFRDSIYGILLTYMESMGGSELEIKARKNTITNLINHKIDEHFEEINFWIKETDDKLSSTSKNNS